MVRASINWLRAAFFPELAEEIQDQDDIAGLLPVSSTSITDYPMWIRVILSFSIHIKYLVIGLVTISIAAGIAALGFELPIQPNLIFWTLMTIAALLYLFDTISGTIRSSPIDFVVTRAIRVILVWIPRVRTIRFPVVSPARIGKTILSIHLYRLFRESMREYLKIKEERTLQIHPEQESGRVGEDITIKVTDDEGNPVEGAEVEVGDQVVLTDRRGKVELSPSKTGLTSIVAKKTEDETSTYQTAKMQIHIEKELVELRFEEVPRRAEADSEIELKITDEDGEPIEDVEIEINNEYVPPTDSRGQTMAYLPEPGVFEIRAHKQETPEKVFNPASAIIEVEPSEIKFKEHPKVVQTGERAYFRVTDDDGNPISNATIRTDAGHSIQTDEEGWAHLTFDEPGIVTVSAISSGSEKKETEKIASINVRVEEESLFWK